MFALSELPAAVYLVPDDPREVPLRYWRSCCRSGGGRSRRGRCRGWPTNQPFRCKALDRILGDGQAVAASAHRRLICARSSGRTKRSHIWRRSSPISRRLTRRLLIGWVGACSRRRIVWPSFPIVAARRCAARARRRSSGRMYCGIEWKLSVSLSCVSDMGLVIPEWIWQSVQQSKPVAKITDALFIVINCCPCGPVIPKPIIYACIG